MTELSTRASKKRPWWLGGLALLVVIGVAVTALALAPDDEDSPPPGRTGPPSGSIGVPDIKQARWKISTERAAFTGKLTKPEKESLKKQRRVLSGMTRAVFDALFLSPGKREKALRTSFTPSARKSYLRARVGVPRGADDVRVRRRVARIAIDGNARATLKVRIIALGDDDKGRFAVDHRSALYAARTGAKWKVFGFSVDQKPFKKNDDKPKGKKSKDKKGQDKKGQGKKSKGKKGQGKKGQGKKGQGKKSQGKKGERS